MTYDLERHRGVSADRVDRDPPAPGKRTLTDRLPPGPRKDGAPSLRGQERDVRSFDISSDITEGRATIDGPAVRDPLDFLDHEAKPAGGHGRKHHGHGGGGHGHAGHHGKPGGHGHGGHAGGGHGQAGGGHAGEHGAPGAAAPRKLLGEVSSRAPIGDGDGPLKTQVVVIVGTAHGAGDDATFTLCYPDGRPRRHGELIVMERQARSTVLGSPVADDDIAHGSKVLVTIPAPRAPELHPDGSIGDDDLGRLEA